MKIKNDAYFELPSLVLNVLSLFKTCLYWRGKKDIIFFDQEPQKFDQEEKLDLQKKNTEPWQERIPSRKQ